MSERDVVKVSVEPTGVEATFPQVETIESPVDKSVTFANGVVIKEGVAPFDGKNKMAVVQEFVIMKRKQPTNGKESIPNS